MNKIKDSIILPSSSMRDAIFSINNSKYKIALVVDVKGNLEGVITDGDIRRSLLKGKTLDARVTEIMKKNYIFVRKNYLKENAITKMQLENLRQMPVLDKNRKLIDLLLLEELIKINKTDNEVVIMAGGMGKRLGKLTKNCPKPMLKIGNKPILEIILEQCINSGFVNFHFSVRYLKEQIKNYFKDGSKWKIKINYLEEVKPLGTAGSLSLLPLRPKKPIMVLNGDVLTKIDHKNLLNFHKSNNAKISIAVRENITEIPYGVVNIDDKNIITLEEKPKLNHFVNAGIYVINPEIIKLISKNHFLEMPELIKIATKKKFKITAFPIHEYWQDVGIPEKFFSTKKDW
jgi:dTDP-glucose pyrophosphorylase